MSEPGKIGIFGASGFGKTTLARKLVKQRPRVVVLDPLDQWGPDFGLKSYDDPDALRNAMAAAWHGDFRFAYVPPAEREAEALHALSVFLIGCQAPYKGGVDRRTITLVVEEMDMSYPVTALPAHLNGMGFLCNRGRHYGVELIGISQYPAQVSTRFRANIPEVYAFNLPFDNHRAALRGQFREMTDELAQLAPHKYLHYAAGQVTCGNNSGGPPARVVP